MSRSIKFEVDGKAVEFANRYSKTRNGFAHESVMYVGEDYGRVSEARCTYLNRTWEGYTYQSAMSTAVRNKIDCLKEAAIDEYKSVSGRKRLSQAQKDEAIAMFAIEMPFYEKVAQAVEKGPNHREDESMLKMASMVASLGDIMAGDTEKEKNDWKKRMLSTVPGIDFPEDFDSLPEGERKKRLDAAISNTKQPSQ